MDRPTLIKTKLPGEESPAGSARKAIPSDHSRVTQALAALCLFLWLPITWAWLRKLQWHPLAMESWWRFYGILLVFTFFCGSATLVLAHLHRGPLIERKYGKFGIVASVLCAVWTFGILRPVFFGTREMQSGFLCHSNLRGISNDLEQRAIEHQGRLPDAAHWCDEIVRGAHHANAFECSDAPEAACAYTFNSALSGLPLERIAKPERTVLAFDGKGGWNSAGGPGLVAFRHIYPNTPPEEHLVNILFVDGHTRQIKPSQIHDLIWTPELKPLTPAS